MWLRIYLSVGAGVGPPPTMPPRPPQRRRPRTPPRLCTGGSHPPPAPSEPPGGGPPSVSHTSLRRLWPRPTPAAVSIVVALTPHINPA